MKNFEDAYPELKDLIKIYKLSKKNDFWLSNLSLKDMLGYLEEEIQEVKEAIDSEDLEDVAEEVGDVLWMSLVLLMYLDKQGISERTVFKNLYEKRKRRKPWLFEGKHPGMEKVWEIWSNAKEEEKIEKLLRKSKRIAIVGLSNNPERDSYKVAKYLLSQGYEIIPINPNISEWNGIPSLSSVDDLDHADIIDVFRRSEAIPDIAKKARGKAKALWLQFGAENEKAKEFFDGLVVMNRCIMQEHKRLFNV